MRLKSTIPAAIAIILGLAWAAIMDIRTEQQHAAMTAKKPAPTAQPIVSCHYQAHYWIAEQTGPDTFRCWDDYHTQWLATVASVNNGERGK